MPLLTRELLNLNRLGYLPWKIVSRGQTYYAAGRVTITEFTGETATCSVRGKGGTYTVVLKAASQHQLAASCTCPYAARGRTCKHMVAAVLAARQYLTEVVEARWDYRLASLLSTFHRPPSYPPSAYALIYYLRRERDGYFLSPHIVILERWPSAPQQELDVDAFNRYLDADRSWQQVAEPVRGKLNPYLCRNLPPAAVQTCNLLSEKLSYYYYGYLGYSPDWFGPYLPLLAQQDVPIFLVKGRTVHRRLHWRNRPMPIEVSLVRSRKGLLIDAGIATEREVFSTVRKNLQLLSSTPAWALLKDLLVPIANPEVLSLLPHLPLTVPFREEEVFRERYLSALAERVPLRGDVANIYEIEAEPVPRLYLYEEEGTIYATMAFGYGEYEVEADPKAAPITAIGLPGRWDVARIHRQLDRERHYYQLLTDARYGLKRAGRAYGPAVFCLRARTHPLDFLMDSIPLLTQAGFEIYGEESLRSARLRRVTPTLRVEVSSGIDWFDVQAVLEYDDQTISLQEALRALRKGKRFVKLADGSFGQIPEAWLERYRHLLGLAEETEEGLRVRDIHLPLLDDLLTDAAAVQAPPDLEERRERFRSFDRIPAQPVPQGFRGELRPYQKAGLDWLHFLHDYDMGGILADDMGLGKTVQVLAFLQSLKEQGKAEKATLLVVPKSLLTNWQREAARFTPELRILQFVGATRRKEHDLFDQHDIVLTTYGTMLRDIEFLRSYRFHYAILDESQAIKNPRAKTARAARMLNADHRLVMTGTPVENTTFELWSQFAFVLPGLLGGVEYFRKEFANPIEREGDGETAARLRKLIYPFILRRTKAQVAPELPPRTERLIYTDLVPAQRRLYNRFRDRYRAELLGLIDQKGLDNARMKILEGLLRLRQICLHPALVEPAYRGKAGKFEVLSRTLETLLSERHKVLIYSQFVQVLRLVRADLDRRGIPYAYLDGQTRGRHAQVDRFQNDPAVPFFLISLRAGGVGLNLTAADYVVLLDPWWNPAVEVQAADRVHRIGQEKPVFIYKLIAKETVEEKILQLQARKRELVENLIVAESSFVKTLTREDVEILFS